MKCEQRGGERMWRITRGSAADYVIIVITSAFARCPWKGVGTNRSVRRINLRKLNIYERELRESTQVKLLKTKMYNVLKPTMCSLFSCFLLFPPLQSFYRQLYFLLCISCFFRSSLTFISGDIK